MSHTTQEVEPTTTKHSSSGILRLSEYDELELLTGKTDIEPESGSSLEDLEETLMGYKENTEQQQAWVRTFIPPTENTLPDTLPDNYVAAHDSDSILVEFMLPSRDTFWTHYTLPDEHWDTSNRFIQLLNDVNVSPGNIGKILGKQVDVKHNGDWRLKLEHVKDNERQQRTSLIDWYDESEDALQKQTLVGCGFILASSTLAFWAPHPAILFAIIFFAFILFVGSYSSQHTEIFTMKNENIKIWSQQLSRKQQKQIPELKN